LVLIFRVGRRADLVGEIFQDRRAFRQPQIAVLDHRDQAIRIERRVRRLEVFAGHHVDQHFFDRNLVLGDEQPHRTARHRHRMHVKLHDNVLPRRCCRAG